MNTGYKKTIKKLVSGILAITLINIGVMVMTEAPAFAGNCNLTTTNDIFELEHLDTVVVTV